MLSKKTVIYTIVTLLILSLIAFSFVRHKEINDIENKANTILQENVPVVLTNANGEERNQIAIDYFNNKFDIMSEDRKIEYVDKMYFSTCGQIEDFCLNESYSTLKGCEYCEGK